MSQPLSASRTTAPPCVVRDCCSWRTAPPLSLVDAYFPPAVSTRCPRLAEPAPLAEGTTHYIQQCTGRAPAQGTDVTMARLAIAAETEALGLPAAAAVVTTFHYARDHAGTPLFCEVGVTPAELWEDTQTYRMG